MAENDSEAQIPHKKPFNQTIPANFIKSFGFLLRSVMHVHKHAALVVITFGCMCTATLELTLKYLWFI